MEQKIEKAPDLFACIILLDSNFLTNTNSNSWMKRILPHWFANKISKKQDVCYVKLKSTK